MPGVNFVRYKTYFNVSAAVMLGTLVSVVHAERWGRATTVSSYTAHDNNGVAGAGCGGTILTQNLDPNSVISGTVQCGDDSIPIDNSFARSYLIETDTYLNCVEFAVESSDAVREWPVIVRLYRDTNGGEPDTASLEQIWPDVTVLIPENTNLQFFTAEIPGAGVFIPAGTTLVVELHIPCRQAGCPPNGDNGIIFIGSNTAGETAPSYIKAEGCVSEYTSVPELALSTPGFTEFHLLQRLHVNANSCLIALDCTCHADIDPQEGDGMVNIDDLLKLIGGWGPAGPPRPRGDVDGGPLGLGNCLVNVDDLLELIQNWGPCQPGRGACCLNDGTCLENQTEGDCDSAGGFWHLCGSTCSGVTCPVRPANDECQDAIEIVGTLDKKTGAYVSTVAWDNTDATTDGPAGVLCVNRFTRELWYDYVAQFTGTLTVDTIGSAGNTDTLLAVYDGASCPPLALLGCNDNIDELGQPPNLLSSLTVPVLENQPYLIRVGSRLNGPEGSGVLNLACRSNDNCSAARQVAIDSTEEGHLRDATNDVVPTCNGISGSVGKWYKVIGNGRELTASLCSSEFQDYNPKLSVYCGTCESMTCVVAANDNSCNIFFEEVSFCTQVGQTYLILVHSTTTLSGDIGDFIISVSNGPVCNDPIQCGPPPLANDFCSDAVDITGSIDSSPLQGDNTEATPPQNDGGAGDPELPVGSPSCQAFGVPTDTHNTLWYKFTAPASGEITIESCATTGPFNDSILALYSGTCGNFVEIGCGEDNCGEGSANAQLCTSGLNPGEVYYVMFGNPGGWEFSEPGVFELSLTSNSPTEIGDDCSTAIPITCGEMDSVMPGNFTGNDNTCGTLDPILSCEAIDPDTGLTFLHDSSWWYEFTNPTQSNVTISMCGSDLGQDAVMAVFSGTCTNLTEIACDDDSCDPGNFAPPVITIPNLAAGTYYINVQAYQGEYNAGLPFNISITCP